MIAAPLSFVKYLGYLSFPIQMVTTYPALARFMASQWATDLVHFIPVFGEKGALLEHMVFDAFFNRPRAIGKWIGRRIRGVLDVWLLLGLCILVACFRGCHLQWSDAAGINLILAVVCIFVLPRILFYPMLKDRRGEAERG